MLINIHCLMHDSFPDQGYHDIKNLRYWTASNALVVTNNSRWYIDLQKTQFIASMISSPEVKMEIKTLVEVIGC